MEDPFLNYFALGLLFFVVIVLVYGIIAIHDIPAKITRRDPCRRLDQPVRAALAVAVSLDLGNGVQAGTWLGQGFRDPGQSMDACDSGAWRHLRPFVAVHHDGL
jgi:hypothetical protein